MINYIVTTLLTVCLILMLLIHIGYAKNNIKRMEHMNLTYLFSMLTTALNSINLTVVPSQSIAAGSDTEDMDRLRKITDGVATYLQVWQATLDYMLTASRCPRMQINMSVSHTTTFLSDMGEQVAYGFQLTINTNEVVNTLPLVIDSVNLAAVEGKMMYHSQQLEQLVNGFMRGGEGVVLA